MSVSASQPGVDGATGRDGDRFADPDFLRLLRAGDREATRQVVRAYLPHVIRAAWGAGLSREQAEDVAQATFLTFLQVIRRFEGRSHVRTFLFGILYKKVSEARRGLARDRQADGIDGVMESRFSADGHWLRPPRRIDDRLQDAELRREIDGCLESLALKQRMAFVLREVEEMGTREICKILEVSPTNLGVLMYRARNRLRECLEAKGVEG